MPTNGNGNGNGKYTRVYVLAGAIVSLGFFVMIYGLADAGVDITPLIVGLVGVLSAVVLIIPNLLSYAQSKEAAKEARLARQENAQTNVVLEKVSREVNGMTTRYTEAKVGEATAEATAIEKQVGVDKAQELAIVTNAALAEAVAAPAMVPVTEGIVDVQIVNPVVAVDVVDKPKPKEK